MLVRVTRILEVISVIMFIKFAYSEKPRVKAGDLGLFMAELVYLEFVNVMKDQMDLSMGSYVILFGYLQIEYRKSIKKNILQLVFGLISVGLMQLLITMCVFWIENLGNADAVMFFVTLFSVGITFVLGKSKVIYKVANNILRNERIFSIILAVVAFAVVYVLMLYKNDEYFRVTDFLLIGVWSLLICYLTVQWQKTRIDNIAKSKELEVRQIYEQRYQELLDSVRKRQHDFDNQLNALSGQQVYAKDEEEFRKNQQEYSACIRHENRYNKLIVKGAGAPILTGFLFNKFMQAESRGCTVTYDVSYGKMECEFAMYQLIDIFGVLLDNAIEALESFEGEKHLQFMLQEYLDQITCSVLNRSPYLPSEKIHEMVKREVSTKGAGRGIGLPKVIELLNEQNVELYIRNQEMTEGNYLTVEFQMKK